MFPVESYQKKKKMMMMNVSVALALQYHHFRLFRCCACNSQYFEESCCGFCRSWREEHHPPTLNHHYMMNELLTSYFLFCYDVVDGIVFLVFGMKRKSFDLGPVVVGLVEKVNAKGFTILVVLSTVNCWPSWMGVNKRCRIYDFCLVLAFAKCLRQHMD